MGDKYKNFDALRQAVLSCHYKITSEDKSSPIVIAAPHGGKAAHTLRVGQFNASLFNGAQWTGTRYRDAATDHADHQEAEAQSGRHKILNCASNYPDQQREPANDGVHVVTGSGDFKTHLGFQINVTWPTTSLQQ